MSGLVDRVKTGCAIEAMSPLGTASTISQTKRSRCGCRSGSNGERDEGRGSFVTSPTRKPQNLSSFQTPCDSIITLHTNGQDSSFHTPSQSVDNVASTSSLHTPRFVTSHTIFRHFTHRFRKVSPILHGFSDGYRPPRIL